MMAAPTSQSKTASRRTLLSLLNVESLAETSPFSSEAQNRKRTQHQHKFRLADRTARRWRSLPHPSWARPPPETAACSGLVGRHQFPTKNPSSTAAKNDLSPRPTNVEAAETNPARRPTVNLFQRDDGRVDDRRGAEPRLLSSSSSFRTLADDASEFHGAMSEAREDVRDDDGNDCGDVGDDENQIDQDSHPRRFPRLHRTSKKLEISSRKFHSYLYEGFRPLSWWGRICGVHPLVEEDDACDETLEVRLRWNSAAMFYTALIFVSSFLLVAENIATYPNECDHATRSDGVQWTKFDRYVSGSAAIVTVPSALITIVFYALNYEKLERFLRAWKSFEARYPKVKGSMEEYAIRAKRWTKVAVLSVFLMVVALSAAILSHMRPPCSVSPMQAAANWASVNFRIWISNYLEASLVFFTLALRSGFEALRNDMAHEFDLVHKTKPARSSSLYKNATTRHRPLTSIATLVDELTTSRKVDAAAAVTDADDAAKFARLRRKLIGFRMCYLELTRFAENVGDFYSPHLLFNLILLTFYCVVHLYLTLMFAIVADDSLLMWVHLALFLYVSARLLMLACVGHSMTTQTTMIKKTLQMEDSSTWPRHAQRELERFVFSAISVGTPVISACGFCSLRRPLCSSIFVQVLSCIVILIQFRAV